MPRRANTRLELRVTEEFLDRIEAWRLTQPDPPSKTAAIMHLINLGLDRAAADPEYRPVPPPPLIARVSDSRKRPPAAADGAAQGCGIARRHHRPAVDRGSLPALRAHRGRARRLARRLQAIWHGRAARHQAAGDGAPPAALSPPPATAPPVNRRLLIWRSSAPSRWQSCFCKCVR
jgi:hypothetical protein